MSGKKEIYLGKYWPTWLSNETGNTDIAPPNVYAVKTESGYKEVVRFGEENGSDRR